jgi:hypothetical protein
MYIGSNIPPRNCHFHFVIRQSIAGISLMWRLAVNNHESINSSLLVEERFFLNITWKTMNFSTILMAIELCYILIIFTKLELFVAF